MTYIARLSMIVCVYPFLSACVTPVPGADKVRITALHGQNLKLSSQK
jgi:hypothetical protein